METRGERLILEIIEKCAGPSGCDICRLHMEEDCLFFPELYRLSDLSDKTGMIIRNEALRNLVELCTFCGLCPCPDIRLKILLSKAAYVEEEGLPFSTGFLSNIQKIGRLSTMAPQFINLLNRLNPVRNISKKSMNIHPSRNIPDIPKNSFFDWVRKSRPAKNKDSRKVAYFTGCSAGYFFPQVGKAAVKILEHNGLTVFVPPQKCCGMPSMLEGDKKTALRRIEFNLASLLKTVQEGYEVVCSCPTCGFFFKNILLENAFYSKEYQAGTGIGDRYMKVPLNNRNSDFTLLPKSTYERILKDDGYFSSINALKRIKISEKIWDIGQYLLHLDSQGKLDADFKTVEIPMTYYAPCHQREQNIGEPYYDLLNRIPGSDITRTGDVMDCCGMGGHIGYKKDFYRKSMDIGNSLFLKFQAVKDRTIITDCLSCKVQLQHLQDVYHPLEILKTALDR